MSLAEQLARIRAQNAAAKSGVVVATNGKGVPIGVTSLAGNAVGSAGVQPVAPQPSPRADAGGNTLAAATPASAAAKAGNPFAGLASLSVQPATSVATVAAVRQQQSAEVGTAHTVSSSIPKPVGSPAPTVSTELSTVATPTAQAPAQAIGHFQNPGQPIDLTQGEISVFRENLEILRNVFDKPALIGQAIANIMQQLSVDARYQSILAPEEIGAMVRAFRQSYAVARSSASAASSVKAKRVSKHSEMSAAFGAAFDALGGSQDVGLATPDFATAEFKL